MESLQRIGGNSQAVQPESQGWAEGIQPAHCQRVRAPGGGGGSTLSQAPGKHSSRSSRTQDSESLCSGNAESFLGMPQGSKTTMVAVPLLLEKEGSLRLPSPMSSLCLQLHLHASISSTLCDYTKRFWVAENHPTKELEPVSSLRGNG